MIDERNGALRLREDVSYRIEGHLDFCDVRDTDGWAFDAYCGIQGEVGALCKKGAFGERTSAADDISMLWHRPFSLCRECHTALKCPLTKPTPPGVDADRRRQEEEAASSAGGGGDECEDREAEETNEEVCDERVRARARLLHSSQEKASKILDSALAEEQSKSKKSLPPPRVPRHALANNLNLGWGHVDEVSIMRGTSHINRDLDKATKGPLSLSERLACNDHMASGGGVLRIGVHGEHKSEAKKDPSRKRGITGNYVALYQPSSVSKDESVKMFKTGLTENILVIFLRPKSNIYAMRHAIKPLRLSRQRLENERQFFEDWDINHRSQTFNDEREWAKYTRELPTDDEAIPRPVLDAGIYIGDDKTAKSVEADTECATTARSAPTAAALEQLEVEPPEPARDGDLLLVGQPGRLGVFAGRSVENGTIRVRWANSLEEDLKGDVVDILEARCACGSQTGGPQCEDDESIEHQPKGTVHVLRTDGAEDDIAFKDWIRRESSEPVFERSLTADVEEGSLRDDDLFNGAIAKLGAQREAVHRKEEERIRMYMAQKRYGEVEPLLVEALASRRRVHGAEKAHPDIATTLNNLAMLYKKQGRYDDAEALYVEALAMWRRVHGAEKAHPDIATTLNNLAMLYEVQRRYDEAEPLVVEALAMWRRVHSAKKDHPDIATSLHNLTMLYEKQGRCEDAELLMAVGMSRLGHGAEKDHPSIAIMARKEEERVWKDTAEVGENENEDDDEDDDEDTGDMGAKKAEAEKVSSAEEGELPLPNGDTWMPRSTDIKASDYDNPDQFHGIYSYQYPFRRGGTGNFRAKEKRAPFETAVHALDDLTFADYEPEPIRRLVNISDTAYTERAMLLYGGLFEKDWHFFCRETNRRQRRETMSRSIRIPMGLESKVGGTTLDGLISEFQQTLQAHKKNPSGSSLPPSVTTDSGRAARSVMSLVEWGGKDVICSPMQRYGLCSNFLSKIGWGGAQDLFITISPSDAHDIRLSKIGHHGEAPRIEISLPRTWPGWFERAKHAADRPMATARWFHRMMTQFISTILNWAPDATRARGPCILGGEVTRYDFTIEETGKGALHAHGQVKIDGIDIRHLEARLENPDLRRRLFALLDSVVRQRKPGQMKSYAEETREDLKGTPVEDSGLRELELQRVGQLFTTYFVEQPADWFELSRVEQKSWVRETFRGTPGDADEYLEARRFEDQLLGIYEDLGDARDRAIAANKSEEAIETEAIETEAKKRSGRLPTTYPIKPLADELAPFLERVLKEHAAATSGAADAHEGWTREDDAQVKKLTNAGSISSLIPPPDPFQYWVRLPNGDEEGDVVWARSKGKARHVLCGEIGGREVGGEVVKAVEVLKSEKEKQSPDTWFVLPDPCLYRPAPTLRDLRRHAAASGRSTSSAGALTTAASLREPNLSGAILQARLRSLEAPGYAQDDPSGNEDDCREWCEVVLGGAVGDNRVTVHRIELYPLSALAVHAEDERAEGAGGCDPHLLIGARCTIRGRGPSGTSSRLTGTIVGSVGTQCEDESSYEGKVDTYSSGGGNSGDGDNGDDRNLDIERLLQRPEAFVRVQLEKLDTVYLYDTRFFRRAAMHNDNVERHYHSVCSTQIHSFPCRGTCHKNQLRKPKAKRKCRLGYLMPIIDAARRHALANGMDPGPEVEDMLEGIMANLCDNPHLVPHNFTAQVALAANQCWKWIHSGKGAKHQSYYNTKYISKSDYGDTASVKNLLVAGLVKLREEIAANGSAGPDSRHRHVQKVARRCVNGVNGNFTVTAVMAAFHWNNGGKGHLSSHEMRYIPLWPFLRRDSGDEPAETGRRRRRKRLPRSAPIEVGNGQKAVQVTWLDDYNRRHGHNGREVKSEDRIVYVYRMDDASLYAYKATVTSKPGKASDYVTPWTVCYDEGQPLVDAKGSPIILDLDRTRQGGKGEGCWHFEDEVTFKRQGLLIAPRSPNKAVRGFSPYAYALAFRKHPRTASAIETYGLVYDEGHAQSQTHVQRPHSKVTAAGFSPWHRVPRRPPQFWEQWVWGELDADGWASTLNPEQKVGIGEYSEFIVRAFVPYMNDEHLNVMVETQKTPHKVKSKTFDYEWLRLLRAVVRCRMPAGTGGVGEQPCPPSCVPGPAPTQTGQIFLRSWKNVLRAAGCGNGDRADPIMDLVREIATCEFGEEKNGWELEECPEKKGWHLTVREVSDRGVQWRRDESTGKTTCEPVGPRVRPFHVRVAQFRVALLDRLVSSGDDVQHRVASRCFREGPVVIGDACSNAAVALRALFVKSRGAATCPVDAGAEEGRGGGIRDEWLSDGLWLYVLGNYQSVHEGSDDSRIQTLERQAQDKENPDGGEEESGQGQWGERDQTEKKVWQNRDCREIEEAQFDKEAGGCPPNYDRRNHSTKQAFSKLGFPDRVRHKKAREAHKARPPPVQDPPASEGTRVASATAGPVRGKGDLAQIRRSVKRMRKQQKAALSGEGPSKGVRKKRGSTLNSKLRIFLDLDDVLADLQSALPKEFHDLRTDAERWSLLKGSPGRVGLFEGLNKTIDGDDLWDTLRSTRLDSTKYSSNVFVLAPVLDKRHEWADAQKRSWCTSQFPHVSSERVIVCFKGEESQHCAPGDVLITADASVGAGWSGAGGECIVHTTTAETISKLEAAGILAPSSTSAAASSASTASGDGEGGGREEGAGAAGTSQSAVARPLVPDTSALAAGYASQLQYTLRKGAIDKNTGKRSPVTVEQGRGLTRMIDNIDKRVKGEKVEPLRMLVAGGPGTGKSVIIDGLRDHADRCGWDIEKRFRFSAPTGKAASLIGGNTLATYAGNSQYRPKIDKLRKYWGDAWLLVIDEVFMVGLTDMGISWTNILKIIDDEDIDVVFVGDPLQMGPIGDTAVYKASFFSNNESESARKIFTKQYTSDEWTSTMKIAWEFYRTFDPEGNPGQGCVIWLDETKRTEGHKEWNEMMHLLRTYFRETLDGTELDGAERREKVEWVAAALAKMVIGTPDRKEAEWERPLLITPSRETACLSGRELLLRDAAHKKQRPVRWMSVDTVRGGDDDGAVLKTWSPMLYEKVGCEYGKKMRTAPREFLSFVGARMVIPKNNPDEVFKLNRWVNGCEGEIVDIVLDPREPDDIKGPNGEWSGEYRDLVFPPVYVVFKPYLDVPIPEVHDSTDKSRSVAAGAFMIEPKTFDFEVPCYLTAREKRRQGIRASTQRKPQCLCVRRKNFYLEQGYAITDICSQGSTYDQKVLVDVNKHPMMKPQSWYIALTRGKDPNNIALLDPLSLKTLLQFAGLGEGRSGATDDGDLDRAGGDGAEERKVCDEDCDEESNEKSNEPPLEFTGGNNGGTRRDLLSEVQRIKRLAEITRNTYPARSRASRDGLRGIDSDWYDEATRGRTVVELAPDGDERDDSASDGSDGADEGNDVGGGCGDGELCEGQTNGEDCSGDEMQVTRAPTFIPPGTTVKPDSGPAPKKARIATVSGKRKWSQFTDADGAGTNTATPMEVEVGEGGRDRMAVLPPRTGRRSAPAVERHMTMTQIPGMKGTTSSVQGHGVDEPEALEEALRRSLMAEHCSGGAGTCTATPMEVAEMADGSVNADAETDN